VAIHRKSEANRKPLVAMGTFRRPDLRFDRFDRIRPGERGPVACSLRR
jgi:hypothetical protein